MSNVSAQTKYGDTEKRIRRALMVMESFVAVTALLGGLTLIASPGGDLMAMPLSMLEGTPFTSFLIPGIILAGVVSGSAWLGLAALRRQTGTAPLMSAASGAILIGWITVQIWLIQAFHFLHALYGILGLLILICGLWWRQARSGRA